MATSTAASSVSTSLSTEIGSSQVGDAALLESPSHEDINRRFDVFSDRIIGRGSYGVVYEGIDKHPAVVSSGSPNPSPVPVAVKQCTFPPMDSSNSQARAQRKALFREFAALRRLDHPNIVKLLAVENLEEENAVRMYLEFMPNGSLRRAMQELGFRLYEGDIRWIFLQALQGLKYLHHHQVLHLDIKPDNMLLGGEKTKKLKSTSSSSDHDIDEMFSAMTVKIADFGTSRIENKDGQSVGLSCISGTAYYIAPEVIADQKAKPESDIYSLAATLTELASGCLPWSHLPVEIRSNQFALLYHVSQGKDHPLIPSHLSQSLKTILDSCFAVDPAQRPNAEQLLQNPYFQGWEEGRMQSTSLPSDVETKAEYEKRRNEKIEADEFAKKKLEDQCGKKPLCWSVLNTLDDSGEY